MQPEEIRHQGVGQFLGRVLASGAVEQLGIAGGFVALLAGLQLGAAVWILAAGIGGWLHASLLLIWSASTALLSWLYWRRSRDWADSYREMTNDLVERMAGHRTRLAQEVRAQWHDDEDELLNQYMGLQVGVDRAESRLQGLVPRGWMVLGISGMAYTLLNTEATTAQIAVSLGGILLAYQALNTIIVGVRSIVNARIAWREVDTLFHAASRTRGQHDHGDLPPAQAPRAIQREYHDRNPATLALTGTGSGFLPGFTSSSARVTPVLTARDLGFRYRAQGRPILQNCNLQVYHGDRILLEGPSGGGKSTFAALLAGLRIPESGILLLGDTDQMTAGVKAWRRHVVAVPQFHENYVFTGTFAFNLLLGRGWPPDPRDLHEADALCRELGLGELIDRMPAGLQQMVGESGWQLSHGEKSRLYIARALLQESDLLILDESFAALDPENLERTINCVLKRASTLLVIAHP